VWRRPGTQNQRCDPPETRKRNAFDHLLVGDDHVVAKRQRPIDPSDLERMPEVNLFAPRANCHNAVLLHAKQPDFSDMHASVRAIWSNNNDFLSARRSRLWVIKPQRFGIPAG
jgi:hypothetical protein